MVGSMQLGLFHEEVEVDLSHDPYGGAREKSRILAVEFDISENHALDLFLGYGSEAAARQALIQQWWRGDVER